jgi:hypothetical protein
MINSKIAKAMKDAEALGFQFENTKTYSGRDDTLYYQFRRSKGGVLTWNSNRDTWFFEVSGEGASAVDAINAASAKSQACTPAPTE